MYDATKPRAARGLIRRAREVYVTVSIAGQALLVRVTKAAALRALADARSAIPVQEIFGAVVIG